VLVAKYTTEKRKRILVRQRVGCRITAGATDNAAWLRLMPIQ